ncbi:hypothetical protein AMAG_09326 [Allomyces macrogynus ATCC 38327]|uniref:CUE domain-containing protein n=1 Tax=Allomyces macrogynus (strain ATCC 38327) TaxID=578462 RepID=A0A0L0SP46_ALLM3|nr:hypothetical protein AMAG_09326 [Allomyces macrogynus ATCC 38327]|eukprot:KNE64296.1 hypothetical protein AMAG_09326 [Allomyces macrogynus ATCC 38327]
MDATIATHPTSPATSDFAEVHDPAAHLPAGAASASPMSSTLTAPTTADLTLESAQALARALPDVVPSAHPSPVPSVSTWSSHADSHVDDVRSRSVSPTPATALPMYGFAPVEPTTPTPTRAITEVDVPAADRFRSATSAFSSSVKALVSSIIDPVPMDQVGSSLPPFLRRASTSSGESGSPQQATPRPAPVPARPLDVSMFDLIEQLTVMFPGVDRVVIEAVVESHGGDVDRAVPALLEISDPDYRASSPVDTPTAPTNETLAHFMASPAAVGHMVMPRGMGGSPTGGVGMFLAPPRSTSTGEDDDDEEDDPFDLAVRDTVNKVTEKTKSLFRDLTARFDSMKARLTDTYPSDDARSSRSLALSNDDASIWSGARRSLDTDARGPSPISMHVLTAVQGGTVSPTGAGSPRSLHSVLSHPASPFALSEPGDSDDDEGESVPPPRQSIDRVFKVARDVPLPASPVVVQETEVSLVAEGQ